MLINDDIVKVLSATKYKNGEEQEFPLEQFAELLKFVM